MKEEAVTQSAGPQSTTGIEQASALVAATAGVIEHAVASAVSRFGASVKPRLVGIGAPEDQMRGPLENLLAEVATALSVHLTPHGETSLAGVGIRPDYAIEIDKAVIGYLEVKAPGKGADPIRWAKRSHDWIQWTKLSALPNVLYTDGQEWALYRLGERIGPLVRLSGHVEDAGASLTTADGSLARILTTFLRWEPAPPRTIGALVQSVAGLCRLLRDEVAEALAVEKASSISSGRPGFATLARDWRRLLFPEATDTEFADQYAQTVTFALLLARVDGIEFAGRSLHDIATLLGKQHSLMGKALSILTDDTLGSLAVTQDTLVRVVSAVDWATVSKPGDSTAVLHLYEHFLDVYDPALRKQSGSYYTPADVVDTMTRLTNTLLIERLDRPAGFASDGVVTIDPAMGTGTYLLNIVEKAAAAIAEDQGPAAVGPALAELAHRLIGFEKQTGPYAVAEMRLLQALARHGASVGIDLPRLFVADTLDNPWLNVDDLGLAYEPIAQSRRHANKIKRDEPVVVVIGNPPYRERAKDVGGWIVNGRPNDERGNWKPLDDFRAAGHGRWEQNLNNLYVYFWRWALWKVFDAHPESPAGVVSFITTSGYLTGPGFAGMREYLRRTADEGWVIDLTPEGLRPDVATRIFPGVQHALAIGIFIRHGSPARNRPAKIHHITLTGMRAAKFAHLRELKFDDPRWQETAAGWTDPLTPARDTAWSMMPLLADLFPWSSSGVTANRSWPQAPHPDTLRRRWEALVTAPSGKRPDLLKTTDARDVNRKTAPIPGQLPRTKSLADETGPPNSPVKIGYRSFDVQYVLPDSRILDRPRPDIWAIQSDRQLWITYVPTLPVTAGPSVTFTAHPPELHHFHGRGGRAVPLWLDPTCERGNNPPGLIAYLTEILGIDLDAADLMAYVAAVCAHSGFTSHYHSNLAHAGGVRIPLTRDPKLWQRAVDVGRHILWLHTAGERCHSESSMSEHTSAKGRPRAPAGGQQPKVIVTIPDDPENMPDDLSYDPATHTLHVGNGAIAPVTPEVWDYQVSGMRIVRKWFGYRKRNPDTKWSSPLSDIRPTRWTAADTTALLDLLNILTLVTDAEHIQAVLLVDILAGELIGLDMLVAAGVLSKDVLPSGITADNATLF